jgi:hypothetical protein
LLPPNVQTLEEQVRRAYDQYKSRPDDLAKNTFMTSMKYQNEVLYYRVRTVSVLFPGRIYAPWGFNAIFLVLAPIRILTSPSSGVAYPRSSEGDVFGNLHAYGR